MQHKSCTKDQRRNSLFKHALGINANHTLATDTVNVDACVASTKAIYIAERGVKISINDNS